MSVYFSFSHFFNIEIVIVTIAFVVKDLSIRGQDRIVSVFITEIRSWIKFDLSSIGDLKEERRNFFSYKWWIKCSFQLGLMTHCLDWTMKHTHTQNEAYKIVCLTTYIYTLLVSLIYIRVSFWATRGLLIRSFVSSKEERKSNQTLMYMCGFVAWDSINVFIVVNPRVNTIEKKM